MPRAELRGDKDTFEKMLSRFKKAVDRSKILKEVQEREFYEKPSVKRRRRKNAAVLRNYHNQKDRANIRFEE